MGFPTMQEINRDEFECLDQRQNLSTELGHFLHYWPEKAAIDDRENLPPLRQFCIASASFSESLSTA